MLPLPPKPDPVALSFAVFGCNRLDAKEITPANPSTANLPQLRRNLADVAFLRPRPAFLFAAGDLVMNYADDGGETLNAQLEAWYAQTKAVLPLGAIALVPIPGNHESNRKHDGKKATNLATAGVWRAWLERHRLDRFAGNGPTRASDPADALALDAPKGSYSFERPAGSGKGGRRVHFVVLDTDTATTTPDPAPGDANVGTRIGWFPAAWAARDLARAQADPGVAAIFVMGHRNLVDPATAKGDAPTDPTPTALLLRAIRGAPKVRAYLCAHVHAADATPLAPGLPPQIIAGNGGSSLEKGWRPKGGRTFGFVLVRVHRSGRIGYVRFARPAPEPYDAPDAPPARPGRENSL